MSCPLSQWRKTNRNIHICYLRALVKNDFVEHLEVMACFPPLPVLPSCPRISFFWIFPFWTIPLNSLEYISVYICQCVRVSVIFSEFFRVQLIDERGPRNPHFVTQKSTFHSFFILRDYRYHWKIQQLRTSFLHPPTSFFDLTSGDCVGWSLIWQVWGVQWRTWSWTSEGHCLSQCLRISSYATRKETTLPHDETTVATTTTAAKRFPSSNKLGRLPASACACVSECIRVCARLWCITHTHTASHQLVSGAFLFSKSTCLFTGCLPFLLFILDLFKAKNFSNCSSSHFSSFSKQLNNQVRSHEHRVIAADHRICVGFSLLKLLLNKRTTSGVERSASVEWSSWRVLFDCLKKK